MHPLCGLLFAAAPSAASLSFLLGAGLAQAASARGDDAGPLRIEARPVLAVGADAKARLELALANPKAAGAILRGIEWLLTHQDEDGRWSCAAFMKHDGADPCDGAGNPVNDVGVTGLAVLALAREGTADAKDRRMAAMDRAARWLVSQQDENGLIGGSAVQHHAYNHATATLALCAVAAATASAEVRDAAKKAVAHVESRRNPYGVWRYQPREVDGDTSITTWCVMACLAGRELGLPVDDKALVNTAVFLDAVTDDLGKTGYARAGEGSSRAAGRDRQFPPDQTAALTAAAMWCRGGLGVSSTAKSEQSATILAQLPPQWKPGEGKVDLCYWFFGGEAMRRCAPALRDGWLEPLAQALCEGQRTSGPAAGSWDAVDPWSEDGGRVYTTSMAVLALQCLYRPPTAAKANGRAPK